MKNYRYVILQSITIIGSLNYDLVTYTNKVPQGGETYQANSFETHVGGKGLNESIAVAKLTPKNSVLLSSTVSSSSSTTTIPVVMVMVLFVWWVKLVMIHLVNN